MKKVLSLVLVIAMVLSSMSFAFASTSFEDVAGNDYEDAINTLVALGVVTGYEDGTYRPEKTVTRAEMAKLIVELLGYGDLVIGSKSNFADTQGHWADAWIALAAGKGLVVGTGDGKFTPDRTVSYDEAITMVVRALGYTDTCNELKNMTWPTNFKVKAAELKLTKDVTMKTTGADRGGVAQLMYNALEAILVTINSDGDVVKSYTTNSSNVVVYTKLLSRLATLETLTVDEDALDEDSKNYRGDLVDLTPYMYQSIDAYVNDDDEVVYVDDVNSVVVTGSVTDLTINGKSLYDEEIAAADFNNIVASDDVRIVVTADGKEYKVVVKDDVKAFYNGEKEYLDIKNIDDLLYNKSAATVTVIVDDSDASGHTGNDNGKVDSGELTTALVVTKATAGILVDDNYVAKKSKIVGENANILLPTDDGNVDLTNITVTGAVDSLEDIKENDVVIAYAALNTANDDTYPIKLVVVRDTVEGTVTKTNSSSSTVYIDGTSYTTSKVTNSVRYELLADRPQVGDEGVFYLDNAGKIFAVDTDGEALTDYAYVISSAPGEWSNKMDGSVKDYPQVKLLTADGETVVYDVLVTIDENAIDDYATYTDNEASPVLKDAQLVKLDAIAALATEGTISFNRNLNAELIKYSVDENGYIDEVEVMKTTTATIDEDDVEDITSDDVIVFSTDDKEVVSVDKLVDGATHTVLYKNGEIIVIVTNKIESDNDGVFGVISSLSYVKNKDGKTVTQVTAFVDGEEVTYLANDKYTIGTNNFSATTTAAAVKFTFNSKDEIKGIYTDGGVTKYGITNIVAGDVKQLVTGTVSSVSSKYVVVNSTTFKFAADVAVYIYDISADEITIGDVSDIDDGYATTVYNTTSTDGIANIVVQVQP